MSSKLTNYLSSFLFLVIFCGCADPQNIHNSIQQLTSDDLSALGTDESVIIGAILNRGQFFPLESAFLENGTNYMTYIPAEKAESLSYQLFHAESFSLPGIVYYQNTYSINYFLKAKAGNYYFSSLFQGREAYPLGFTCSIPAGKLVYLGLFDLDHYRNGRFFRKKWVVQQDRYTLKNIKALFRNRYPDLYDKFKEHVVVGHCFAKSTK